MKIFLDDLCDTERKNWIPEGYIGARDFFEFKKLLDEALEKGEKIEGLSFDNDLGEGTIEGWEIAKWLTEAHPEIFAGNPELRAHSANPSARKNIEYYFELGQKHYKELIEAKDRPRSWGETERKK